MKTGYIFYNSKSLDRHANDNVNQLNLNELMLKAVLKTKLAAF